MCFNSIKFCWLSNLPLGELLNRVLLILVNFQMNYDSTFIPKRPARFNPLHKVLHLLRRKSISQVDTSIWMKGYASSVGEFTSRLVAHETKQVWHEAFYAVRIQQCGFYLEFQKILWTKQIVVDEITTKLLASLAGNGHILYTDYFYTGPAQKNWKGSK